MIKLKAFLLSLVLVIATLALLNVTYVKKIDDYYKVKDNSIRYSTSYEKYKSRDIITNNITPNTLVLMGSSELVATINDSRFKIALKVADRDPVSTFKKLRKAISQRFSRLKRTIF